MSTTNLNDEGRQWYVVNTYSGHENKVRENILKRVESMGIQDCLFNIVIPTHVETVLKGYAMPEVPENRELRDSLADKTLDELTAILTQYKTLHNTTDVDTCKRAIRAIEIAEYYKTLPPIDMEDKPLETLLVAIDIDREVRRSNITKRLHERLNQGMVAEVESLLNEGISPEDLIYY